MRPVPLWLALAVALSRRVCRAAPPGAAWLDVKPATGDCVALVYRFPAAGPPQHCEPEGQAGPAVSSRPYYRDTTSSDTSWLASNTSLLCDTHAGDTAGWAAVACGAADDPAKRRYQLRWWPLHQILARNGLAAHGAAAAGYLLAWALRDGRPAGSAVDLAVSGPADSSLRFCVDNGTLCESFERTGYRSVYPSHGSGHMPSARQAGLALRWPATVPDEQSYQAKAKAKAEASKDAAQGRAAGEAEGAGAPSVAQRIRRMRRMYAKLT
jgi:hypothetical protein